MKIFLKSVLFNILFYTWTAFCSLFFLPVLLLPRGYILKLAKFWINSVVLICKYAVGLEYKIIGQEKLTQRPLLYAVKHQSAWETFIFYELLIGPSVVLKKELLWIPFFGWYLKKLGVIPLSRSKTKGRKDLNKLVRSANRATSQGQPIVIFPEGTRSLPTQKGVYHSGIASLYLHLNIPVVPIAHNAGLFWPRRGFLKYPGTITIEILDPIEPGLSRLEFMRILEEKIEAKTQELVKRELTYV